MQLLVFVLALTAPAALGKALAQNDGEAPQSRSSGLPFGGFGLTSFTPFIPQGFIPKPGPGQPQTTNQNQPPITQGPGVGQPQTNDQNQPPIAQGPGGEQPQLNNQNQPSVSPGSNGEVSQQQQTSAYEQASPALPSLPIPALPIQGAVPQLPVSNQGMYPGFPPVKLPGAEHMPIPDMMPRPPSFMESVVSPFIPQQQDKNPIMDTIDKFVQVFKNIWGFLKLLFHF